MRLMLAALVLGTTILVAVSGALAAEEHSDPSLYMDRVVTSSGTLPVYGGGVARNPMDIFQEVGQNERSPQ